MKSKTGPLNLTTTEMFSVQNLWFGPICSMFLCFLEQSHINWEYSHNVLLLVVFISLITRGGRFSDGWGSCDRREKRFLKPNHDIPSTAETRAKNKACQVWLTPYCFFHEVLAPLAKFYLWNVVNKLWWS